MPKGLGKRTTEKNRSVKWARMLSRLQTLQGSGFRTRVLAMNRAKRPQFFEKRGNQKLGRSGMTTTAVVSVMSAH
jgi:hypothetical protein